MPPTMLQTKYYYTHVKMKISEAVEKYIDWVQPNDEELREEIRCSMNLAMKMVLALPYEVKVGDLERACAIMSAYIISNGLFLAEDINHNRNSFNKMVKTICEMTAEAGSPLGMCLDFFYGTEP